MRPAATSAVGGCYRLPRRRRPLDPTRRCVLSSTDTDWQPAPARCRETGGVRSIATVLIETGNGLYSSGSIPLSPASARINRRFLSRKCPQALVGRWAVQNRPKASH